MFLILPNEESVDALVQPQHARVHQLADDPDRTVGVSKLHGKPSHGSIEPILNHPTLTPVRHIQGEWTTIIFLSSLL